MQSHTVEYAACAATPEAIEVCIEGAKGLAMTGYDILASEDFQREIKEYHLQQVPGFLS